MIFLHGKVDVFAIIVGFAESILEKERMESFFQTMDWKNYERVKDSGLDFLVPKGKESIRPINTPSRGSLKY